jgi:hypothetical protein
MTACSLEVVKIRNFALLIATLPLVCSSQTSSSAPSCLSVGQLSGWDILNHTLSIKSDAGDYSDLRYNESTIFTDGETSLTPLELNIDDRVCIEASAQSIASRVLVTRRSRIDRRNREDLIAWDRDNIFGVIQSLEVSNSRLVLRTASGSDVLIDVASPVASWTIPEKAFDPAGAIPADWKQLSVGEDIYVRGTRIPETETIRARVIISGGFRSFVGSVESMQPLEEQLTLRDFRLGHLNPVHFIFTTIYVVGRISEPPSPHLYSGTVADLKEGDSVMILARQDPHTGAAEAFLLITGFSRSGIVRPAPGQSPDWIFKAVGFGH